MPLFPFSSFFRFAPALFLSAFLLPALLGGGSLARAFAGDAPARSSSPGLRLLSTAQVDSAGIFLDQIIATEVFRPTPKIRLAAAPALGQTASLSRAQITAILENAAPDLARASWSGADSVRVSRRIRRLAEAELKDALTAVLQSEHVKDRGQLELRLTRPWSPVNVPDEPLMLRVLDLPANGVGAHFIVRFEIVAGEQRLGPWQMVAQAKLWRDVPVARSALRRGQLLAQADIGAERRDVLPLREPLNLQVLNSPGLELVENVSAGTPLLNRSVRLRPVIQRGQVVDGIIQDGALSIILKVEALADGLPGQTVRVRNTRSRREFFARVHNEQTVLIHL
jgi:flagella basal body P-ring formation protein FlgA